MLADFIRQSFHTEEPSIVFLGGDDHLGFGHGGEQLVDALDILPFELMVIGVGERCDILRVRLQVDDHLLG